MVTSSVATSKPTVYAVEILKHFGLSRHFEAIYGSELDGTRTDKTELIAHLLKIEQISVGNAVMVGDRKHDIIGARNNGVLSVGVLYGYGSAAELAEIGPDICCASVVELTELLSRI